MQVLAHDPGGGTPPLDLLVVAALCLAAACCRRRLDAARLLFAAAVIGVPTIGPLHDVVERSVTGHMIQHLLAVGVAAPLVGFVVASSPTRIRSLPVIRHVADLMVMRPSAPIIAGAVHAIVLSAWHVPTPYDAAVRDPIVHGVEHFTMFASGVWWWAAVVHHVRRHRMIGSVMSMFVVITAGAVLGVFMMFAPSQLYEQGGTTDQRNAGAVMAGITGALYGAAAMVATRRAVERLQQPRRRRVPISRSLATLPVAVALSGAAWSVAHGPGGDSDRPVDGDAAITMNQRVDEEVPVPGSARAAPGPDLDDEVALGQGLYRRDCAACHGPAGEGSTQSPPIADDGTAGVYYYVSTGRMPISDPDDSVRRSTPVYDAAEIAAIVAYTDTFVDGPPIAEPDLTDADVAAGGQMYRQHCASCHGAEGIGGAQAFGMPAPSVLHAEPNEAAAAMQAGPGEMPEFSTVLDDDEMAAVIAYIHVLQDPPSSGVVIPGGRVGEGLLAWMAGIGILLLAARWIGRSS